MTSAHSVSSVLEFLEFCVFGGYKNTFVLCSGASQLLRGLFQRRGQCLDDYAVIVGTRLGNKIQKAVLVSNQNVLRQNFNLGNARSIKMFMK